jgi:hypothetical protein
MSTQGPQLKRVFTEVLEDFEAKRLQPELNPVLAAARVRGEVPLVCLKSRALKVARLQLQSPLSTIER